MPIVTLKHPDVNNGSPVRIVCTSVKVAYKKNNGKKPNANFNDDGSVVDVSSDSIENPVYTLQGVKFEPSISNSLTHSMMIDFMRIPNVSGNPIFLNVTYSNSHYGGEKSLLSLSKETDIPVTLDDTQSVKIDTTESDDGYLPSVTLNLVETKG